MRGYIAAVIAEIQTQISHAWKALQSLQLLLVHGEKTDRVIGLIGKLTVSIADIEAQTATWPDFTTALCFTASVSAVGLKVAFCKEGIHVKLLASHMKNTAWHD